MPSKSKKHFPPEQHGIPSGHRNDNWDNRWNTSRLQNDNGWFNQHPPVPGPMVEADNRPVGIPSAAFAQAVAVGGVSNMYINEPFYGATRSHAFVNYMAEPSKPRLHNNYPPATDSYLPRISRPSKARAEEVAFGGVSDMFINEPFYGATHSQAFVDRMAGPSKPELYSYYPSPTASYLPHTSRPSRSRAQEVAFGGVSELYINEPFYGAIHSHTPVNHMDGPSKPGLYNSYPPVTATYLPPIPSKAIAKKVAFGGASQMYINEPFYGAAHPHTSVNHMAGPSRPRVHNHYQPATTTYLPTVSRPSKVFVEEVASSRTAKRRINGYYDTTSSQVVANKIVPNHPRRGVAQDGVKVIQGMEREAILRHQHEQDKERLRLAWGMYQSIYPPHWDLTLSFTEKQLRKTKNMTKAPGPSR